MLDPQELIKLMSESQDGSPLRKYTEDGDVCWGEFKEVDDMSTGDALNVLLLKIATSDTPVDDMEYVQKQLGQAALVLFKRAAEHVEFPPPPWDEVLEVAGATGRCSVCGEPAHAMDCR